jgi:5-bromo-4-chloroindolyl phosphate hydrolysis protein
MANLKDLLQDLYTKANAYDALNELVGANGSKIQTNVAKLSTIDGQITDLNSRLNSIRDIKQYNSEVVYAVDDIIEANGVLYKCIKANAPEGTLVTNTEFFTAISGTADLTDVNAEISATQSELSSVQNELASTKTELANAKANIKANVAEIALIKAKTDQIQFEDIEIDGVKYSLVSKKVNSETPYPEGKPENTTTFELSEHDSDATSECIKGTLSTTLYHSGEYTPKVEEKSFTESAENLDDVSDYKVFKFTKMNSEPEVQNNTNGEVVKTALDYVILSAETNTGDITVTGNVTTKIFEPETVTETAETVLTFNNAYEEAPQFDVAGTGVTVELLQTEAPYTSAKVSKELAAEVEYNEPVTVSEDIKLNVNRTQITYTYDDGTSEVIDHHNDETVTLTMDDGSTDTTTVGELAKAFENGQ